MKEIVITTEHIREDIGYVETLEDLTTVAREVEFLVDDAVNRLDFMLIEANETLVSTRALANRFRR